MAVWSETNLLSIENNHGRFDAEYYKPEYLEAEKFLSRLQGIKLRTACSKIDVGHVGPMVHHYTTNGIPLLQTQNVKEFFLKDEHIVKITPDFHSTLIKSQVRKGSILIARSGSFGSAAIYLENEIINSADIIIVEINNPRIDPLFAVAFMNSKYGSNQLIRFASGGVQGHVNLRILENYFLPIFDDSIQKKINNIIQKAYNSKKMSEKLFVGAQNLLESELGLDKFQFKKPVGYTSRFSELEASHRIDAQHFQPRFEQLINQFYKIDTKQIRDIRLYNRRGVQPVYVGDGPVDVVNSQHIGPQHIDYDGLQKTSEKAFSASPEGHIKVNDLLIYTTGAYIGRTNVYLSNQPALASNHVNILRLNSDLDAAYMSLVFQSVIGHFQTLKHSRGSAQAELYPTDIDKFIVPILAPEKQTAIGDLVRNSLEKKQESKRLLEKAKFQVEQLIEQAAQGSGEKP
ncbi:MAG: restriction endonuclease subunit S [Desulfobacteraceae bacterium]